MTEFEKMINNKLYDPSDSELSKLRTRAHQLCKRFNDTNEDQVELREQFILQLLGGAGEDAWLEPNIIFDYGCNTYVGKNFYSNFNLTVLDSSKVIIGDDCFIGPNVSIVTAMHSLLPQERNIKTRPDGHKYDLEYSLPITIGNNVWIGTGTIITAGVTIGDNVTIGAGSVVTRDIPNNYLAYGVPCKPIRKITQRDSLQYKGLLQEDGTKTKNQSWENFKNFFKTDK